MLVVLFAVVIYTDWRWLRIFNAVTYPTMLAGLVLGALEGLPGGLFTGGLVDHVAGLVLAFALSYPFYAAGGLKAGDAKLLMAIGAVRGVGFLLFAAVPATDPQAGSMSRLMKTTIPYGVALGAGGMLALALEVTGYITVSGV